MRKIYLNLTKKKQKFTIMLDLFWALSRDFLHCDCCDCGVLARMFACFVWCFLGFWDIFSQCLQILYEEKIGGNFKTFTKRDFC